MSAKVIPFKQKPPSKDEMAVYRMMTKGWSSSIKQMLLPRHYEQDSRDSKG